VSTHSAADVDGIAHGLVDYIGFGPVFESPTKAGVREARGLELLRRVCATSRLPVVAIGGIQSMRADAVFSAGAASCAVISEIERSRDPVALIGTYDGLRTRTREDA
jgi:thiamine-phosphate diphosphorylase